MIWLTANLRPDHWTIAAFRPERFKAVLREFNLVCRQLDLFGAELVAIDGAKFKAVNSPKRHYTAAQLAELIARLDQRIADYVTQLDQADETTADLPGQPIADALAAKLAQLQTRRMHHAELHATLAAAGQTPPAPAPAKTTAKPAVTITTSPPVRHAPAARARLAVNSRAWKMTRSWNARPRAWPRTADSWPGARRSSNTCSARCASGTRPLPVPRAGDGAGRVQPERAR